MNTTYVKSSIVDNNNRILKVVTADYAEKSALNTRTLAGKEYDSYTPIRAVIKDIVECLNGTYVDFDVDNIVSVGGNIIVNNLLSVQITPNQIQHATDGTLAINENVTSAGQIVEWPDGSRTKDTRTVLSGGSDEADYMLPFEFNVANTSELMQTYLVKSIRRIPIDGDHSWIIVQFTNNKVLSIIGRRTADYDGQFQTFVVDNTVPFGYNDTSYQVQYNCSIYPKNGVTTNIFQMSINKYNGKNFTEWAILTLANDRLIFWKRQKI